MPPTSPTSSDVRDLRARVAEVMRSQWMPEGYTAPNNTVYPWQWLWDSCFHTLIWLELGDRARAARELVHALSIQDATGFVPHMNYERGPDTHADFWGRRGSSSITQPPMFGHALAECARHGIDVPSELVDRARHGLAFLLRRRARHLRSGLVVLAHPWESGADDSPRWDDLCPEGISPANWHRRKGELVASIVRGESGAPIANPACVVASVSFNALIAFNTYELLTIIDDEVLRREADELVTRLDGQWDREHGSWIDAGATERGSGRIRTLDALLPLLVTRDAEARGRALASLLDHAAHGAPFGPCGVHRDEAVFSPDTYWRGPTWPQLDYLCWLGARRAGESATATAIARQTVAGALRSGLAEYWQPDTGRGLGAIPQAWAGLAIVMAIDL
jgi:glycogen debranching enzyme